MTTDETNPPDPGTFDNSMVSGLLRIAFDPARRPVDHLIERLQQADALDWFKGALARGTLADAGDPQALLIAGEADAARLDELKDQAKAEFAKAGDANDRMRGLLHYLFIIAAGLEHHGLLLSSQPRGEISAVLLELALSLPAPWNDFVAEAAMTPLQSN